MITRQLLFAVTFVALASLGRAGTLVIDMVDTAGAGTPIAGANWDGSQIVGDDWGTDFKDFQFNLTSSPPYTLSDLIVLINADAQNKAAGSTMGLTIFAGPIVPTPVFSNSLGTITVAATNWTQAGYESIAFGPGGLTPAPTITNLPDTFFFRVWGTGTKNVTGFKAKFLQDTLVAFATNVSPSVTMSNFDTNTSSYSPAPTFNYTGPVPTPTPTPPGPGPAVPEPGTWAMAGLLALTAGYMRWRRRTVAV